MREHNYKPNPIAQSLKRGRSKSIGVIVCNIDNNFFSQVINGIESVARQKDYNVIITQSRESYEREVTNSEHLSSRSVDGLIISLSAETQNVDHLTKLPQKGLPIVFFAHITSSVSLSITLERLQGYKQALADAGLEPDQRYISSANMAV